MSELASKRKERLRRLAVHYRIPIRDEIDQCVTSSEEDLLEYLEDEWHIDRWVSVTYNDSEGGIHYLKTFQTRDAAAEHSVEYVTDDIFTESPVALVDLDDPVEPFGKVYRLKKLIPIYEGVEVEC